MKTSGGRVTLETESDMELFEAMQRLAQRLRDTEKKRATVVFNAFMDGSEFVDIDDDPVSEWHAVNEWKENLDRAIETSLDHKSMPHFVALVAEHHYKAQQAARAHSAHAENRAMKQEVFAWLDTNMPNFKSMDSAAEAIAGKVAPVKFRTARDWVGEWKKIRSTGTP